LLCCFNYISACSVAGITEFIAVNLLFNGLECLPALLNGVPEGGQDGRRL